MAQFAPELDLSAADDWIEFLKNTTIPEDLISKYASLFVENAIDARTAVLMDKASLGEIGIKPMGHRLSIIDKLTTLKPENKPPSNAIDTYKNDPSAKITAKLPTLHKDMTHPQFRKFSVDWGVYKDLTKINPQSYASNLYNACDEDTQNAIVSNCKDFFEMNETDLLKGLESILTQRANPSVHRMQFGALAQAEQETIQNFITRLRSAAVECEFSCPSCQHDLCEVNLRDQFIRGLTNNLLQTDILAKAGQLTTLDLVISHAESFEAALRDQSTMQSVNQRETLCSAITQKREPEINPPTTAPTPSMHRRSFNQQSSGNYQRRTNNRYNQPNQTKCYGCGGSHQRGKCPAYGKTCNNCGIPNHFASVCQRRQNSQINSAFLVATVQANSVPKHDEIAAQIVVGHIRSPHRKEVTVSVFPDSGANICLAGTQFLQSFGIDERELIPCKNEISVVGGGKLSPVGRVDALIQIGKRRTKQVLYFCKNVDRIFLSKQACMSTGILPPCYPAPYDFSDDQGKTIASTKQVFSTDEDNYSETQRSTEENSTRLPPEAPKQIPFAPTEENIPKLKKYIIDAFAASAFDRSPPFPSMTTKTAHIHLKDNSIPAAQHTPIPVPIHWKETIKQQLVEDVRRGIIKPVDIGDPAIWCSPMVVVRKPDGSPRRTVDYQKLNRQCYRETHYTESPLQLATMVPPGQFKTKLDIVDSYHSLPLDEESRPLTTFITEWGRYQYLRMPQGFVAAGDAFVRRYNDITKDVPNHVKIVDDALLYSGSIEKAFWDTWNFLTLGAQHDLVFSEKKFDFCQMIMEFSGLTLTETGVAPSPPILDSILNFPTPTTLKAARAWFGLVNQVAWAYSISDCMKPFRDLIRPSNTFYWDSILEKLFQDSKLDIVEKVKGDIESFDANRRTCLQTDWSKSGIGYLLLQKHCDCKDSNSPRCCTDGWKLVFAGSRFTTAAESRYSPTEGECLGVQWALHHSKMFTLGCSNLFVSVDHQPLLGILNDRDLFSIKNNRLQNIKEKTFDWSFEIYYNPGKWHKGPDALSRKSDTLETADFISHFNFFLGHEDQLETDCSTSEPKEMCAITSLWNLTKNILSLTDISEKGILDEQYTLLRKTIGNGFPNTRHDTPPSIREYFEVRNDLSIEENVIYYGDRIIIPKSLRKQVLEHLHSAHQGITSKSTNLSLSEPRPCSNYKETLGTIWITR